MLARNLILGLALLSQGMHGPTLVDLSNFIEIEIISTNVCLLPLLGCSHGDVSI